MTFRAVLAGLTGVVGLCVVTPYLDLVQQGSRICANHLPVGVMFLFLVFLVVVNPVIGLVTKRPFTRAEIGVALIMVTVASSVPSIGYATIMLPLLVAPAYFASPENGWASKFGEYVPSWFAPHGQNVGKWFYEGLPAQQALPWHAWTVPLVVWGVYALLFWGSYFFLGCLLRRQWIDHERLTFPLAQVPLDIMGASERPSGFTPLLRSPLMWVGFLLIFAFHATNSLHTYFGFFPEFKLTDIAIGRGFVTFPMNAWDTMIWNIYPSLIGIAFLLSSEIGFSIWFFYWFNKFQKLAIVASGLEGAGQVGGFSSMVFFRAQEAGAFAAVAFFFFWGARRQLGDTLRRSLRGDWDPKEPVAPHMALVWFGVCVALLAAFSVKAGMNWWAATLTMVVFYMVAIGLTRMVSAGGTMYVECSFMPHDVVNNFLGTRGYGFRNMTVIQFPQRMLMFNQEVNWWPYMMNSFKIAHGCELRGRQVGSAVLLALVVAVPVSCVTALRLYYGMGGLQLDRGVAQDGATWPFNKVVSYIESPVEPNRMAIGATIFGALFMLGLLAMNRNYLWWRLNPLAYIMGSTGTLEQIWLSVFIGWLISLLILRYSGLKMYRRLRPFFLGLLLGEFAAAAFWMIIDYESGLRMHRVFP